MTLITDHKNDIEWASRDEALELESYISQVVKSLGHPEALVTDESYVSDFLCIVDEQEANLELSKACLELGMTFDKKELVISVARRLKDEKTNSL